MQATDTIKLFKSNHPEYRDGEQQRDFLYVKDAVDMTLYFAAHHKATGLFNIGSGIVHTWMDLTSSVCLALDRKPNIEFIEMPMEIKSCYQYFTQADIGKLRAAGYPRAPTPLDTAVRNYVVNYLMPGSVLGSTNSETVESPLSPQHVAVRLPSNRKRGRR